MDVSCHSGFYVFRHIKFALQARLNDYSYWCAYKPISKELEILTGVHNPAAVVQIERTSGVLMKISMDHGDNLLHQGIRLRSDNNIATGRDKHTTDGRDMSCHTVEKYSLYEALSRRTL